ncbi:ankyrin repeat-containing domain protein [Roridomyces roridus]|uniref:Ankyrin repeat-containing domain protein n=1 Tax=Roridomyces roridus TaxID=1738132 RepID=A0AAD7F968_9AGAR|nr:ankyrin repeat-containing domain protein [Roridomyces roridus]
MADIVGLLASILQFVDAVSRARQYIQDFRNAPKEQKRLLLEIQNLEPLIGELDMRVRKTREAGLEKSILDFAKPPSQLKEIMERLVRKLDSAKPAEMTRCLAWSLWGKDDVREALDIIERFKSLLNAWLGIHVWNSTRDVVSAIHDFVEDQQTRQDCTTRAIAQLGNLQKDYHDYTISALQETNEQLSLEHNYLSQSIGGVVRTQDAAKREEIIEWYSPVNFFLRQADIFNTHQPGTGRWLLETDSFKRWESCTGNILWGRGMPGAGKTVLVSIVVDHLRSNNDCQDVGVAVMYLNHKETDTHTPSKLLASLWRQLVFKKYISSAVRQLYEKHYEPRTRPSAEEDRAALRSIISEYSKVFLIVDALDEYPEKQRDTLLRYLCALGPTVNLMLTSRPHIRIEHTVPKSLMETLEIRAAEEDVRKYLDEQISRSSRLSKHISSAPDLQDAIEGQIKFLKQHRFLLAKLQIESLETKHTVKAVRDTLNRMPSDLKHTYDDVIDRIDRQGEDDKRLAWLVLSWIAHAQRPLHPHELREALAVELGATQLNPENLVEVDTIISVCAGLVVLNREDETIRLIHYTVQKHLEHLQVDAFPNATSHITATCITYLSFEAQTRNTYHLITRKSFLQYAVEYCLVHARGEPEALIRDAILAFLADCDVWYKLWRMFNVFYPHERDERREVKDRLWIAAVFGLEGICQHLMKGRGAAELLQKAALMGFTDMVETLLRSGASVEFKTPSVNVKLASPAEAGLTLQAALPGVHPTVVRILQEHGAGTSDNWFKTPLQAASLAGHRAIVQLLLEHGADTNLSEIEGRMWGKMGSPLQAASLAGHTEIVNLLLENGAEPCVVREWYAGSSALQAASEGGHAAIVRLLLKYGASVVEDEEGEHGNALQRAVGGGHEGIVRLLIDHGAKIAANDGLLNIALERGHAGIIRLLLEHGAQIDEESIQDGSALLSACRHDLEMVVRLLLERGVNVNTQDKFHRSALQTATFRGHAEIVQLLLEHGADPNAAGSECFGTALHTASQKGYEDIVLMLLHHGADVNAEGIWGGKALRAADCHGRMVLGNILSKHGGRR